MQAIGWGLGTVLLVWGLWVLLLVPDANGRILFDRAQRLEASNQALPALRTFRLLIDTHPNSPYVPDALWHEAELLMDLARAGDVSRFSEALDAYQMLADKFPQNPLGAQALLRSGDIYSSQLRSLKAARRAYETVLRDYATNRDLASQAMLRLGRTAMAEKNGKEAQTWFQRVLQKYAALPERCAEAQYLLGETYESLFTNKEHKTWARNAYDATISNYPQNGWAAKAQERLGMLVFRDLAPKVRRVFIEANPLPTEGPEDGSLFSAVRLVLAARGVAANNTLVAGWGLEPFYTGFSPQNPGAVVKPSFEPLENVIGNANLKLFDVRGDGKEAPLQTLQDEVDDASTVLVYNGRWQLVVGYDSGRDTVQLQSSGTRFDTVPAKKFAQTWKQNSSVGRAYTMLSFRTPGEVAQLQAPVVTLDRATFPGVPVAATPTAAPSAQPNAAPGDALAQQLAAPGMARVSPLTAPTFVYRLPHVSENAAHRRAIRRAADLMLRPRDAAGNLLNLAALRALADEMKRLAELPNSGPSDEGSATADNPPVQNAPENGEPPVRSELPTPDEAAGNAVTGSEGVTPTPPPGTPMPTPVAAPAVAPNTSLPRVRALLAWREAPLQRWIAMRRQAAAYLDMAAGRLNNTDLREAAESFRESVSALENAAAQLPPANSISRDGQTLSEGARQSLRNAATEIEKARSAEARAARIMSSIKE